MPHMRFTVENMRHFSLIVRIERMSCLTLMIGMKVHELRSYKIERKIITKLIFKT